MDKDLRIEKDEDVTVVTFSGQLASALNMFLPWNLGRPVFRQVIKKGAAPGEEQYTHCDFTEAMREKLEGKGLPGASGVDPWGKATTKKLK